MVLIVGGKNGHHLSKRSAYAVAPLQPFLHVPVEECCHWMQKGQRMAEGILPSAWNFPSSRQRQHNAMRLTDTDTSDPQTSSAKRSKASYVLSKSCAALLKQCQTVDFSRWVGCPWMSTMVSQTFYLDEGKTGETRTAQIDPIQFKIIHLVTTRNDLSCSAHWSENATSSLAYLCINQYNISHVCIGERERERERYWK